MLDRLTTTTFSSGPNDKILAVDAYKVNNSASVNVLPDINDSLDLSAFTVIKSSDVDKKTNWQKLFDDAAAKKQGLLVTPDNLVKGVVSGSPNLLSALKSLPSSIQTGLTNVKGITNISATINGITSIIKKADLATVSGLGAMVNSLSGANFPINFKDNSGLTGLSTNLIRESSKLGIPNTFTAFTKSIEDKTILSGIVKNLTPDIIKNSDSSLLAEIADSPVATDIVKYTPSFGTDFVSNYQSPLGLSYDEQKVEFFSITSSLNKIDPDNNICRKTYIDESITDKSFNSFNFSKLSKDFKSLLEIGAAAAVVYTVISDVFGLNTATNTPVDQYMTLASGYGNPRALDELKRNFPLVLFRTI